MFPAAQHQAEDFKALVDVGDFVGVTVGVRRTDKGELSVLCHSYEILTKSLLPLPDKFHGLLLCSRPQTAPSRREWHRLVAHVRDGGAVGLDLLGR